MTLVLVGFFTFLLGIQPDLAGLDNSPVIGFVQVGVWLTGLATMLLGAYLAVRVIRNGRSNSLIAEVGSRLIATGYVLAVASSLADFIGIGSHQLPFIYFGPVQVFGLALGVVTSLAGLLLYWPSRSRDEVVAGRAPATA
jgi:hypothetical protein